MLPESFTENMISFYGRDEAERFISCMNEPMNHCLRVNTLKITPEDFLALSPFHLEPVPWCPNAFYYDDDVNPAKHPYYYAGLYYLQEPSATLPATVMPIEEGDRVLDLCAAPGGKSTELGAKLRNSGVLISNDISASRAKALLKNIELFGIGNSVITTENSNKLAGFFEEYFDKILIDAPCSGEGMFRKSNSMITAWEKNGIELFTSLQTTILRDAVRMLRPGGSIVYSTCTYNPYEDERMVEFILSLNSDLYIDEIPYYDGFVPGIPENGETGNSDLSKTMHLFPHRVKGEGHFVSLIKSRGDRSTSVDNCMDYRINGMIKDPYVLEFLEESGLSFDRSRLIIEKDRLYYINESMPDISGLRILRKGLFMGELKKNRFEPSQSLAMYIGKGEYKNTLDLPADDIRVIKYLKGETIEGNSENGLVLVTVDGYPLGFAKAKDNVLKNKYLAGWRMM